MASKRKPARWRQIFATAAFLLPVVAFVVWSSFQVSQFQCEVCMAFDGRKVCRTVTAATEEAGVRGGIDNACGMLTSGVTNTLRCTRSAPRLARCEPMG